MVMADPKQRSAKKNLARLVALLVVALAIVGGYMFWVFLKDHPVSEDATIQAEIVHISSAVPGKIIELNVKEGARVAKEDVLFRLDPEVYELRVKQAKAEVAVATATLATIKRHIRAETSNASIADEQIRRAQTNLELASRTVQRLRPLAQKGYVTKQELDTAVTVERDARVSLTQAQAQAEAAEALIGETAAAEAALEVAQVALMLAEKALSDTVIRAPNDGLVVGLHVSEGERLLPDQSLFTLINAEHWYATAYYRETDLPAIEAGMCATVYTMMAPHRTIQGKVVDIGWGVSTEDMLSLPRSLPFVQKSLNWVRVAQRFPVRVQLFDPPAELMRMGASASVSIRAGNACQEP